MVNETTQNNLHKNVEHDFWDVQITYSKTMTIIGICRPRLESPFVTLHIAQNTSHG